MRYRWAEVEITCDKKIITKVSEETFKNIDEAYNDYLDYRMINPDYEYKYMVAYFRQHG